MVTLICYIPIYIIKYIYIHRVLTTTESISQYTWHCASTTDALGKQQQQVLITYATLILLIGLPSPFVVYSQITKRIFLLQQQYFDSFSNKLHFDNIKAY